ncbi:MAG: DNA gyrase inhibitor YacG [Emcibacter sp.]|nr:DNA gyrase inhibitor YacG [Emcibacter sp.]
MKAANSNNMCPICKKHPAEPKFHPFCSARCADVDLGRWFKGSYAIPDNEPVASKNDLDDMD